MMRRVWSGLFLFALSSVLFAQSNECVGSIPVTTFRLSASPAGGGSPVWMPVRQLNNLPAGYRLRYQPTSIPADLNKDAAIAVVLVPKSGDEQLNVLQPGSAATSTEWIVPFDAGIAVLVYAPQGLDQKRLTNLITRDPELISAMAEYAEQTKELEDTLEELRQVDDDSADALDAGRANTPTEQALLALLRALNPAVSSFDPLGSGRRTGPATAMGRGANLFFENAGSMVPGGGILPSVKQFLMPDTEFRGVYGAGADGGAMTLCAQRQGRTRNKIAYIWAYRLTTAKRPETEIPNGVADLPIGLRTQIPLRIPPGTDWELLERVTDWGLVPVIGGGAPIHVPAHISSGTRSLHVDLRNFPGAPTEYSLEGRWDWSTLRVKGTVRMYVLDNLSSANVTPASQDHLVTNSGPVALDLTGANLRFVTNAWLHRSESERRIPVDLRGKRDGPADHLNVEVDTDGLRPGTYLLALQRIDGATADVPVQMLPAPPVIDSKNLRIHLDDATQSVTFKGANLDRITSVESPRAAIELMPSTSKGTERVALIRLRPGGTVGESLELAAKVEGLTELLHFPGVLQIAAARPKILEVRLAPPVDLPITLKPGELPSGSFVGITLRSDVTDPSPSLIINCDGAPADRASRLDYTPAGAGTIYFVLDSGTLSPGDCKLNAMIETPERGTSDAFPLGTVAHVPRIDKLILTNEATSGGYIATLEGWNLETIQRTGWSATNGLPATETPRPIAGQGARQTMRIAVPWPAPAPKAPLYVWLRGENEGRATTVAP